MKTSSRVLFAAVGLATLLLAAGSAPPAYATNDIGKAENVACTACHDKPGSKLYTDKGKYYELMRTFDGYDEIIASFQKCTSCHARKPGSLKLTRQGKRFSRVMEDMNDLRGWLLSSHPPTVEPDQADAKGKEGTDREGER